MAMHLARLAEGDPISPWIEDTGDEI